MARPLRVNQPGAWHYVTARGQNRQPIYLDAADGANFLQRLAEFPARFGLEVHAYVLMPDHYHLLLRAAGGAPGRGLQWLNTGYGMWWNRRHGRLGHVFHGRYRGVVVQEGDWLRAAGLHLHLNPVTVGPAAAESAERRRALLRGWKWSSLRAVTDLEPAPAWLHTDVLPAAAGGPAGYLRLVEQQLDTPGEPLWLGLRRGLVLGDVEYAAAIFSGLTPGRENPERNLVPPARPWPEIVRWVEQRRGQPWAELCERRGEWGRELAWWGGRKWSGMTLRGLGEQAGGVDYAVVAKAIERFVTMSRSRPQLADDMAALARFAGG